MIDNNLLIGFLIIIFCFIFILVLGIRENIKRKNAFIKLINRKYGTKISANYNDVKLNKIKGYYNHHQSDYSIDDITWSDLNMDKIYSMMNNTYSSAGEEYLYYKLRSPLYNSDELNAFDKDVEYFSNSKTSREAVLLHIKDIGKLEKCSVYDYIKTDENIKIYSNISHYISLILLIASIIMLFIYTGPGIVMLIGVISYNIFTYYKYKSNLEGYFASLKYIMRLYNCADNIIRDKDEIFRDSCSEKTALLEHSLKDLKGFAKNSKYVFVSMSNSGSIIDVLANYINMLVHIDLIMLNNMIKKLNESGALVDNLVTSIGYFETVIAIASIRNAFDSNWCRPVFDNDFKAVNAFHPLLNNPVTNDFEIIKPMLITGSNASGKSTFLRTVAINQLLSQTINTVFASEYHTSFYRIISSMSLHDDIIKGDSYFMAEIKALSRIINANKDSEYKILCFVDEVLRGTNTVERIAASCQVLKYFNDNNVLCVAATHDIELTELLSESYDNYHFKEEINEGDVLFSYKLLKGKATSRNAIKLLELIGYDKDIVDKATSMADNFVNTGNWSME